MPTLWLGRTAFWYGVAAQFEEQFFFRLVALCLRIGICISFSPLNSILLISILLNMLHRGTSARRNISPYKNHVLNHCAYAVQFLDELRIFNTLLPTPQKLPISKIASVGQTQWTILTFLLGSSIWLVSPENFCHSRKSARSFENQVRRPLTQSFLHPSVFQVFWNIPDLIPSIAYVWQCLKTLKVDEGWWTSLKVLEILEIFEYLQMRIQ